MTDENQNINLPPDSEPSYPDSPRRYAASQLLADEPAYKMLLSHYQNAEWDECLELLSELEKTFPDDPTLHEIQEDIAVKQLFREKEGLTLKENKKTTRKKISISFLVILAGILLGIGIIYWISAAIYANANPANRMTVDERVIRLQQLEDQAINYIRVGNTQLAQNTIIQIQEIDANYAGLTNLISQTNQMLELDGLYQTAKQYLEEEKYDEALGIFQQINAKNPLFRDVAYQIEQIEKKNSIVDLLVIADTAFLESRWQDVITSYEAVLEIDPAVVAPKLEEQLFMSYYETIKNILSSPDSTVEEIDQAELYYRKAVALVPQDKAFTQERRDLQTFLVGLLNLKYRQIAKATIDSPYITEDFLTRAVDYLKKATTMNPDDAKIKSELDKAQLYLTALQKFNRMEWDSAIINLEKLYGFQATYANGMVQKMLYESYTARGQRFLSAGYFLDARGDFEKAEIIAWDNKANKLQLLESQINMGMVLGKMYYFQDAIVYFNMALDSVNINDIVTDPDTLATIQNARQLAASNPNFGAFEEYRDALANLNKAYYYKEVTIAKGQSLAGISIIYNSTIKAIREKNNLPDITVSKSDITVLVPIIQ